MVNTSNRLPKIRLNKAYNFLDKAISEIIGIDMRKITNSNFYDSNNIRKDIYKVSELLSDNLEILNQIIKKQK